MRQKLLLVIIFATIVCKSQNIELYSQFNGRYDFTTIGNTLNVGENGAFINCAILTSSSATLNIDNNSTVVAAYLYWAGSGTGDFNVLLNNTPITAERTFTDALDESRVFFAAFADITSIIQNSGNGTYTLSDLDLTNAIIPYCSTGTNFGGWAITIILQNNNFPVNQVNVYDGLEHVPDFISINLPNLNVIDTNGAKIGFLAWEGDSNISVNETLTINGFPISNLPLNPVDNAFNGTNTFTNSNTLYNMDIDVYDIQNLISIGDTSANIQLSSGQDFVMINNIITVLNNRLPDASSTITNTNVNCDSREVILDFSIHNFDSTNPLPEQTLIHIYANGILLEELYTSEEILVDQSINLQTMVTIPNNTNSPISITVEVDPENSIIELHEDNNTATTVIELLAAPDIPNITTVEACDEGNNTATFYFNEILSQYTSNDTFIGFYSSYLDASVNENEISITDAFQNQTQPQNIFYRYENENCFAIHSFQIQAVNCLPFIPQGFSPNGDGINDVFEIEGLLTIYEKFTLKIYNRYGTLIYQSNENEGFWDGKANRGNYTNEVLPVGTYYYILETEDEIYKTYVGWVYLNK